MRDGFNGLPPMTMAAPTSAQMFGQVDVNRNGAPPNGIHADLRTPDTTAEKKAAPAAAATQNPLVVLVALVLVYVALNAGDRKRKK